MADPFERIAGLDRLLHEPSRLAIMTALATCRAADFLLLQRLTGLSKGNLSSHLSKLERAALVKIEKGFSGRMPNTQVSLTRQGRGEIDRHWKELEELRTASQQWTTD